jgi:uncharacterized membrane protein YqjE
MAIDRTQIRVEDGSDPGGNGAWPSDPPIGELFRQLTDDATRLIKQEVALGKAELKQTASALGKDAAQLGIAVGLGLLGALSLTAFLIVGLGTLLANYWLSALIVAVVLLAVAAVLAKQALDDIKQRDLKPTQTIETLQADAEWAKREVEAVKRDWQS